jgi:glycosyltransferase involved in cell wall biosynthesis
MRILYFSRDYTTHDHRFLSALANTEHKVSYLRLEQRGHQLEDRALPPEIEQLHWAGGQTPATFRDGPRLLLDLKRVIRQVKPDLIQAGPIQRCAFLAALSGFRPIVTMSWGYDLIFDAPRNAWWRWATRYTLKRSAVLVGDSAILRQLATSYGMSDEHIITFPWGVDIHHFTPPLSPSSGEGRTFTLLSTRGWEPIYGVEVIARAFVRAVNAAAAAQRPTELHLLMLGNGSQAGLLRRIFLQGGVDERVHCPGQVGQADLPRYYRSADLYLSASHSDGSSISLLEAMACGRPAIVSDIPGNREWVTPNENGWWFPDGDAEALAQAILHAIEQRASLPEMGRKARQLAEARADWQKNFLKLEEAYRIALSP